MTLYYEGDGIELWHGDCLDVLTELADASVDAVVTDPPYGLSNTDPAHVVDTVTRWARGDRAHTPTGRGFMGKEWDAFVPPPAVWDECYRILKPGGHLLAFAGSRTFDLMTLSVRFAGFDIRDSIAWLYASGFPKSLDVSKAIDKAAGATREVVGESCHSANRSAAAWLGRMEKFEGARLVTAPATPAAQQWQGWGTALKPAFEPVVVARKPLAGTVAANVLAHGTGALNIDGARVRTGDNLARTSGGWQPDGYVGGTSQGYDNTANVSGAAGRWPTNVVLDGHTALLLDQQSGTSTSKRGERGAGKGTTATFGEWGTLDDTTRGHNDSGGASRFFPVFRYEAKAPTVERPTVDGQAHATVKPLDLMRWLVRLVCPRGGLVVDPFAGSGTTAEACLLEGMRCWTAERDAGHLPLIVSRLSKPLQPTLLGVVDELQPPPEWPPPAPPPARLTRCSMPPPPEAATLFDVEGLA